MAQDESNGHDHDHKSSQPDNAPAQKPAGKSIWRSISRGLLIAARVLFRLILLVVSVILVALLTLLASFAFERGRLFWAEHALVVVNQHTPLDIQIEALAWPELGRITSGQMALAQAEQPLVNLTDLDLDISVRHLLGRGMLHIQHLHLGQLEVFVPEAPPEQEPKAPVENPLALIPTQLPQLPSIQVDDLEIQQVHLRGITWPENTGPGALKVTGNATVNTQRSSKGGTTVAVTTIAATTVSSLDNSTSNNSLSDNSRSDNSVSDSGVSDNNSPDSSSPDNSREIEHKAFNDITAQLSIREADTTTFGLTATTDAAGNLTADITLTQAASGWLCTWAKLACQAPIQAGWQLALLPGSQQLTATLKQTQINIDGEPIGLTGAVHFYDATDRLTIEALAIEARNTEHTLAGWLDNTGGDIQLVVDNFPLTFVKPWYPDMAGGTLNVLADLRWADALWRQPLPEGRATLTANPLIRQTPVNAGIELTFDHQIVRIGKAKITADEMSIAAKGRFDIAKRRPTITATLNHLKDDKLRALLPPAIAQKIPADIQFHAQQVGGLLRGTLDKPIIMADVNILGQYRELPFSVAGSVFGGLQTATVQGLKIRSDNTLVSAEGTLDLEGSATDIALEVSRFKPELLAKLDLPIPAELTGSATFAATVTGALAQPAFTVTGRYQGGYQHQSEVLPFNIRLAADGQWAGLDNTEITIEELSVATFTKPLASLTGRLSTQDSDLSLRVRRLPARLFDVLGYSLGDGRAEANLRFTGAWQAPELAGYVSYGETLALRTIDNLRKEVPLILHANIESPDKHLLIDTTFTLDKSHAGDFQLNIPWHTVLADVMDAAARPIALAGSLQADVDTTAFQLFLDTDQSSLGGQVTADITLGGDASAPELNGKLQFSEGYFRQLSTGTRLNQITLDADLKGQQLRLNSLTANDGGEGRLELTGGVDWRSSLANPLIDLKLMAKDASLYETTMVSGAISGNGAIFGSAQAPDITGRFELRPLNINIDSVPASGVPQIKVTEIYEDEEIEGAAKGFEMLADLDIEVNVSKQAYVRGRGLMAELAGKITVKGTSQAPLVSGEFKTLKGEIALLDRPIKLNEGKAQFTNSAFGYSIPATFKRDDVEINILVSGDSEEITMTLSSIPDMPQEEILSYLLFGESVQNISALQAIRLASAINTINKGSSFDPVGSARNFLGVDSLNIGQEQEQEGGGVNIGVGKYLNERVYIEFEQSSNPAKSWEGHLEIDLNHNFHLESSTTGEGRSGVSLEWERDY